MVIECRRELEGHILPFWRGMADFERGGFYGFLSGGLALDKDAPKGVILHARILWFFSSCYTALGGEENLRYARHAYEFLRQCVDAKQGGVYWMMDCEGKPLDTMKHTYNQAFAVYALSAYYAASGDKEALALALELFELIESKTRDAFGYGEAFDSAWRPIANEALSENGIDASKTMNTVLHLIEAYTELLRVSQRPRVEVRLRALLSTMEHIVFDAGNSCLRVFFDERMNVLGDIHSYGHDIEASWLMDRACEAIGDEALAVRMGEMNLRIARNILDIALENGALNNERDGEAIDRSRIWWVQAEGVVGFLNAHQKSGDPAYLSAASALWAYCRDTLSDKRPGGEWFARVSFEGEPAAQLPIVEPWKCPYHNGRMCLEVIRRGVMA